MNLKNVDSSELILTLLRDKIALKHELRERDSTISILKEKINRYERINFNYGK